MHVCDVIRHMDHSYSVMCYLWYWLRDNLYEDDRNVYFVSHVCSIANGVLLGRRVASGSPFV
jgi:hypothetical protein